MISLLLFILTIFLALTAERIGSIALEITGLNPDQASFQAMSAYCGGAAGSREIDHPQRRKIIKTLIRLGSAGVITTMATMVGTLASSPKLIHSLVDDRYLSWLPINKAQLLLIILVACAYLIQYMLAKPSVSRLIKEFVTQILLENHIVDSVQYDEVLSLSNGYGLIQVEVCEKNPLVRKPIKEARLQEKEVSIISIERLSSETIVNPGPEVLIELGDRLLCFGPLTSTTNACCVVSSQSHVLSKAEKEDAPLALWSPAPVFALQDQHGQEIRLEDYRGKRNIILLFYPKDKSFTCSAQLGKFGRHLEALDALETDVFAINPESIKSHATFGEQLHVNYSILSDSSKQTCKAYKALMLMGLLVNRTVYVIDKEGKIRYAQRGNPSIFEVVGAIQQLDAPIVSTAGEVCQLIS